MLNLIQPGSKEFTAGIKAGSNVPGDFAHWGTARLISNRSSANWHSIIIKVGPCWSGSVALKMQKMGQRKVQCLSRITSFVLQKGRSMILPVQVMMKN